MRRKTNIYSRLEHKFSFDEMMLCGDDAAKHKATTVNGLIAYFFFEGKRKWSLVDDMLRKFISQAVANIKNAGTGA